MSARHQVPVLIILLLVITTVVILYAITHLLHFIVEDTVITDAVVGSFINKGKDIDSHSSKFKGSWLFRLSLNLLGYATIFIPGFLIFKYVNASKYLERSEPNYFAKLIRLCFIGGTTDGGGDWLLPSSENAGSINKSTGGSTSSGPSALHHPRSTRQDALLLMLCFVGLQGSYLTWGLLQEKVMTQEYSNDSGEIGHFKDSQFLVFINRILAFILSGIYISFTRQPRHMMPLYKYVYCSFSNIMSSWCQYEALKFISFPTQVLSKACKIIPVMVMGKIVSNQKYDHYEYITALTISLGMVFFMFGSAQNLKDNETETTFSGIVLLASYILFDSFTSNWQGALFNQYHMSSVQMMCSVNLFSCLFTVVSLAQQGGFSQSVDFMSRRKASLSSAFRLNTSVAYGVRTLKMDKIYQKRVSDIAPVTQFPKFIIDCVLLSISSASGQFFIFFTISVFGPVVFIIIMTIRQGLAILLSCIIYQHPITAVGIIGIIIVFVSVFLRIYCKQKMRSVRRRATNGSSTKV